MNINEFVKPYADVRRNKARMLLRISENSEPIIYDNAVVQSFSLIQEYQAQQASQPRGEVNIDIADENKDYDIANSESLYYQLNDRSVCEIYVSSVDNTTSDEFVQVAKMYVENVTPQKNIVQLTAVDASGIIANTSYNMIHVFQKLKYPDEVYTSELLTAMFELLGLNNKCVISEELDKKVLLKRTWFYDSEPFSIPKGIGIITASLTNAAKATVRAVITSNGDMRVFAVNEEPVETITKHQYARVSVEAAETTGSNPKLVIEDRGNILREPGDRIIVEADRNYDIEVFMLRYEFEKGALKGQMKGLIQ